MLDLTELEQFAAFAELGTLTKTAERLHISQPTLTRTMRRVEESFGAPLFRRGKNRIELNETGRLAAEYAQKLLFEAEKAAQAVQAFDRSLRTVTVRSCAPAPLWSLLAALSHKYPNNTISSQIVDNEDVISAVLSGQCDVGVLPYPCQSPELVDVSYVGEKLFACIPEGNELARRERVSFSQLNGFNCLVRDQLGFWSGLCRDKMPASRFLIQADEFEFEELVRTSTLLSFSTDLANPQGLVPPGRVMVPISDPEADVTYHLVCRPAKRSLIQA